MLKRKLLVATLVLMSSIAGAKEITDIAGRTVEISDNVDKIVLGEGRMLYSLSVLKENPFKHIVAWRSDLIKNDPDTVKKYAEQFPEVNDIPDLGDPYASDVNLESIIKLNPDVYLLNLGKLMKARESGLIKKLDKVGIPTVFVDFRQFPTQNTVPSMLILGDVLNEQERAMKFITYYRKQMGMISSRLAQITDKDKPLVFIENAAGLFPGKCCKTYGQQNFGKFVALAGGINWGSSLTNGFKVKVNPEAVFSEDFDVIIGTGANWRGAYKGAETVSLGYFATADNTQKELAFLANRKAWSTLKSVKNKRFYSVWHQFYNSPYHFIAIQAFAKWLHPELFKDIDVDANFKQFHEEFLPIEYSGQFMSELK